AGGDQWHSPDRDVAQHRDEHEGGRRHVERRSKIPDPRRHRFREQQDLEREPDRCETGPPEADLAQAGKPATEQQPDHQANRDRIQDEHQVAASATQSVAGREAGRMAVAGRFPPSTTGVLESNGAPRWKPWPSSQPIWRRRSTWDASSIPSAMICNPSVWPRATI